MCDLLSVRIQLSFSQDQYHEHFYHCRAKKALARERLCFWIHRRIQTESEQAHDDDNDDGYDKDDDDGGGGGGGDDDDVVGGGGHSDGCDHGDDGGGDGGNDDEGDEGA